MIRAAAVNEISGPTAASGVRHGIESSISLELCSFKVLIPSSRNAGPAILCLARTSDPLLERRARGEIFYLGRQRFMCNKLHRFRQLKHYFDSCRYYIYGDRLQLRFQFISPEKHGSVQNRLTIREFRAPRRIIARSIPA